MSAFVRGVASLDAIDIVVCAVSYNRGGGNGWFGTADQVCFMDKERVAVPYCFSDCAAAFAFALAAV